MAKKIKYVQLEPAEVLLDFLKSKMTTEQFGCYWLIIMYLYCDGGKMNFDLKELSHLCICTENFEKVWEKIKSKFQIKNNKITHKRVASELRRARKFIQHQRAAGLKGAKKRWQAHSESNIDAVAKENKGNVIEETQNNNIRIRKDTISPLQSLASSNSLRHSTRWPSPEKNPPGPPNAKERLGNPTPNMALKMLNFNESLQQIIKPRNQSDRTSFRNIGNWLMVKIKAGVFNERIIPRVLEYAAEAVKGRSRNPAAVFTSILKKELNYKP